MTFEDDENAIVHQSTLISFIVRTWKIRSHVSIVVPFLIIDPIKQGSFHKLKEEIGNSNSGQESF